MYDPMMTLFVVRIDESYVVEFWGDVTDECDEVDGDEGNESEYLIFLPLLSFLFFSTDRKIDWCHVIYVRTDTRG